MRAARHDSRLTPFRAGMIAVALTAIALWLAFFGGNPFASPYTLEAVFRDASNVKPNSPVRIAGVDVGRVTKVESIDGGGARVEMEIRDEGLPIHEDATLKVRPRIFLEGNAFVDLRPGSPSAPELPDDAPPIPVTQTATPVQIGDVLTALQSDTREDLQTFLDEYSRGLEGEGAKGFRESVRYWEGAYRDSALANEAALGQDPDSDVQRVLNGQRRTFAALARDTEALKSLVTNFSVTTAAFAREGDALEAAVPALNDTLRAARPALTSVNGALPSLRAFAVDALPGVESSEPVLRAGTPFLAQARRLMARDELGGTAEELRRQMPSLVGLTQTSVGVLEQARALSACTSRVLAPFITSRIPNPDEPGNTNQRVINQMQRGFVGLSGESRLSDGNLSWFRAMAVPPGELVPGQGGVRPAPPSDRGNQPPPRRPDVPCETQDAPNLNAPGGALTQFISSAEAARLPKLASAGQRREAAQAVPNLLRTWELRLDRRRER